MTRLAAVDVGSNTVHALVADAEHGRLHHVGSHSKMVELGPWVAKHGRIGEKADEALAALREVIEKARADGFEQLVAGATEATREAADHDKFLAQAGRELGVPMHLISSAREAQLSFLGVASRHAVRSEWLMADLGGGSLELVVGRGRTPGPAVSLPIGSGVLAQRFLSDPPTPEERAALRKEALRLLAGAPESAPTRLVVTGGTAVHLRGVVARSAPSQLTTQMLVKAGKVLDGAPAAPLAKQLAVEESRVRAMRGGVEVLLLLLDWCGLARLHVSLEGVRDGMILAYLERGDDWWR